MGGYAALWKLAWTSVHHRLNTLLLKIVSFVKRLTAPMLLKSSRHSLSFLTSRRALLRTLHYLRRTYLGTILITCMGSQSPYPLPRIINALGAGNTPLLSKRSSVVDAIAWWNPFHNKPTVRLLDIIYYRFNLTSPFDTRFKLILGVCTHHAKILVIFVRNFEARCIGYKILKTEDNYDVEGQPRIAQNIETTQNRDGFLMIVQIHFHLVFL